MPYAFCPRRFRVRWVIGRVASVLTSVAASVGAMVIRRSGRVVVEPQMARERKKSTMLIATIEVRTAGRPRRRRRPGHREAV